MMMRETKLVALGLLLLHFYFFSICASTENQACNSSCGDIPIRYPFRLKHDPSSCRRIPDPGFELVCENNHTILYGKYYVTQINYHNRTVRIVTPGVRKGHCFSYPDYSLRLSEISCPYDTHREFNSVVFMNCTRPINAHNYIQITPCDSNNGSSFSSETYAYALVGDSLKVRDNIQYSCTIGLTVITQIWKGVSEPSNRSMSNLQENLLMGLELSYSPVNCSDDSFHEQVGEKILGKKERSQYSDAISEKDILQFKCITISTSLILFAGFLVFAYNILLYLLGKALSDLNKLGFYCHYFHF